MKATEMTRYGYISDIGDRLGSAEPRVSKTSSTTPENSVAEKAGLCRAQTLGYNNKGPVHSRLACLGGGVCIATPPPRD